jgi:hypothetical protein
MGGFGLQFAPNKVYCKGYKDHERLVIQLSSSFVQERVLMLEVVSYPSNVPVPTDSKIDAHGASLG